MKSIEIACRKCLAQSGEMCDPSLTVVNAEGFHTERVWDAIACTEPDESTVSKEALRAALINSDLF